MAYDQLSADQCYGFCEAPVRPAIVSTVRANGRPHSVPIWFALDGLEFLFTTSPDSVKGRNLRRDPRLTLCVQDDHPPFAYVLVEGSAECDSDQQAVRTWATRIGGRYMGADRAEEYGARNSPSGELLVRVSVTRISGVRDVAM